MNRAAHEAGDMVKLIELEGEEKLFYPAFPIDIAVIRATYADERGNCTFEREGVYAEALAQAQAAHNSGGRVIVQVEKVVSLRLPGRTAHPPPRYLCGCACGGPAGEPHADLRHPV